MPRNSKSLAACKSAISFVNGIFVWYPFGSWVVTFKTGKAKELFNNQKMFSLFRYVLVTLQCCQNTQRKFWQIHTRSTKACSTGQPIFPCPLAHRHSYCKHVLLLNSCYELNKLHQPNKRGTSKWLPLPLTKTLNSATLKNPLMDHPVSVLQLWRSQRSDQGFGFLSIQSVGKVKCHFSWEVVSSKSARTDNACTTWFFYSVLPKKSVEH